MSQFLEYKNIYGKRPIQYKSVKWKISLRGKFLSVVLDVLHLKC